MSSILYTRCRERPVPPKGIASTPAETLQALQPTGMDGGTIGPNSVLQTVAALKRRRPAGEVRDIVSAAGIPDRFPTGMIPEAWFIDLVAEMRARLPAVVCQEVLREAGYFTAKYVSERRIPTAVRWILALVPVRWGLPLLLKGCAAHAWTFAGSGEFRILGTPPRTLVLSAPPTCPPGRGQGFGGAYYEAAFEELLAIAASGVRIRELSCRSRGDAECRFSMDVH